MTASLMYLTYSRLGDLADMKYCFKNIESLILFSNFVILTLFTVGHKYGHFDHAWGES